MSRKKIKGEAEEREEMQENGGGGEKGGKREERREGKRDSDEKSIEGQLLSHGYLIKGCVRPVIKVKIGGRGDAEGTKRGKKGVGGEREEKRTRETEGSQTVVFLSF